MAFFAGTDLSKLLSADSGGDSGDSGYQGGGSGTTPGAPAAAGDGVETVALDEGGLLALAFGEHLVAGNLVFYKRLEGPPPVVYAAYAQGEGPWSGVVKVWYAGEELFHVSEALTDTGFHFHRGTLSTGNSDPDQGLDTYLAEALGSSPEGLTFNKTAVTIVKLPEKYSTEERPDKLRGRYQCSLVSDYDPFGTVASTGYNANPAMVAAAVLIERAKLPVTRIDWTSWLAWRDFCSATISWDDGTTTWTIPRFEAHMVFTSPSDVPAVLDAICGISCTRWQDDGQVIRFLLPTDTTSQHTFNPSNFVQGSLKAYPRDIQSAPRHLLIRFRDLLDPYLGETSWGESKRDALIDTYGDKISERAFPNMNHSQAQRIAEYQLRMETDNNQMVELNAKGDSLHLLPGDFVTMAIGDVLIDGEYLIRDATDSSPEKTPDERTFVMQKIVGNLYSDSDHRPIERGTTP